jgi:hypothetical protein
LAVSFFSLKTYIPAHIPAATSLHSMAWLVGHAK